MKTNWSELERYRDQSDPRYPTKRGQRWGRFIVPIGTSKLAPSYLLFVASCFDCVEAGELNIGDLSDVDRAWEHVSVSTWIKDALSGIVRQRLPSWEEMARAKDLFWEAEECVIQFHPPRSVYNDSNPNVLHLWRHPAFPIPVPNPILVGATIFNK